MNARSLGNKLDYVFGHIIDNNFDEMALKETCLSNEEVNNRRVVIECSWLYATSRSSEFWSYWWRRGCTN